MEYIIEMFNIRKEFSGIVANDNITLQIKRGEIHALLGENGAGKSTLMSILFGLYQPEAGVIKISGKEVKIASPNVANDLGIGMVHQHFKLVDNFTVTENIILGMEKMKSGKIDIKSATERIRKLSEKYKLSVDPNAKIEDISVGTQQKVEILKMLYRDSDILIFDEPTAVLTPQEIHELMEIMKKIALEGKTIIIITHKLKEIKAIADRCTVIRRGKVVDTINVSETSEQKMAEMMVGRHVDFVLDKKPPKLGSDVLKIENLNVLSHRGLPVVKNLSLSVRSGEILGVAGVDGNGQTELIEAITGLTKVQSGRILVNGKDISKLNVRERNELGLGHIPEDRHKYGLVLDFNLEDNIILKNYYKEPFSKHGVLNRRNIHTYADKLIKKFDIRSAGGRLANVRGMSGGNQQKAIIAREVDESPEVMIVAQPTRGLDVGAVENIHKKLLEERDKGRTILLFSLELDEIFNLSDRIAVMYDGRIVGIVNAMETNENEIGLMMAGDVINMHKNKMVVSILAVILGFTIGAVVMLLSGYNPIDAYCALLKGAGLFGNVKRIGDTLLNTTTLILTGLSIAFAFRTGLFNIGASGQMLMGGFVAVFIGVKFKMPYYIHVPLAVICAILAGAIWAFLPGIIKARYKISEVVTTIMMNYIALWTVYYLVPVCIPGSFNTESKVINESASLRVDWMTKLFHGSYVNIGLFLALLGALLVWWILEKTTFGYELKSVGFNVDASKYAGMNVSRNIVLSMMISGALAGLAGATFYIGYANNMKIGVLPSQGYDGIAVSLLGLNSPLGVIFAALLFGFMNAGSLFMSLSADVPNELVSTIAAIIIYFAATSLMFQKWIEKVHRFFRRNEGDQ